MTNKDIKNFWERKGAFLGLGRNMETGIAEWSYYLPLKNKWCIELGKELPDPSNKQVMLSLRERITVDEIIPFIQAGWDACQSQHPKTDEEMVEKVAMEFYDVYKEAYENHGEDCLPFELLPDSHQEEYRKTARRVVLPIIADKEAKAYERGKAMNPTPDGVYENGKIDGAREERERIVKILSVNTCNENPAENCDRMKRDKSCEPCWREALSQEGK